LEEHASMTTLKVRSSSRLLQCGETRLLDDTFSYPITDPGVKIGSDFMPLSWKSSWDSIVGTVIRLWGG
jgi:hypothetical protein